MTDHYTWRGGSELLLRHGQGCPVTLLVIPALFEEANRMRRFTVDVMRRLATLGIGSVLPDLPGQGESVTPLLDVSLGDWLAAVSAHISEVSGSISFRGGALLDHVVTNRWRFAPDTGERLLRDMVRATAISSGVSGGDIDRNARVGPSRLAGNAIGSGLYTALVEAVPWDGAYTSTMTGAHLWRSAEPASDPALAEALAGDIALWIASCGV